MSEDSSVPATGGERNKLKRDSMSAQDDTEYEDPETLILLQQKDEEIKKMQQMLQQMQEKLRNAPN